MERISVLTLQKPNRSNLPQSWPEIYSLPVDSSNTTETPLFTSSITTFPQFSEEERPETKTNQISVEQMVNLVHELLPKVPVPAIAEWMASAAAESLRVPDQYSFTLKDQQLVSPETHTPIENFVLRQTILQKKEWLGFLALKQWANQAENGQCAVWISPPHETYRDKVTGELTAKIIVHQKKDERIFNTAIVLPESTDCLKMALQINPSLDITDSETLRSVIISSDGQFDWNNIPDSKQVQMVLSGEAGRVKQQLIRSATIAIREEKVAQLIQQPTFWGGGALSCDRSTSSASVFSLFFNKSVVVDTNNDKYGSLKFNCPHCGHENTRPWGKLIKYCQSESCGKDVTCGHKE